MKCLVCGRVVTKDRLIDENKEIIEANIEDFKDEVLKEVEKEFKKFFK